MNRNFQELLSHPDVLQATLLRHMTSGLILSSALNAGPNPGDRGRGGDHRDQAPGQTLHRHRQQGLGGQRDRGGQRGDQRGHSRY